MKKHYFSSRTGSSLSNFYMCEIDLWNWQFQSSEQAYQFFKCVFHNEKAKADRIKRTVSPLACYRIGKAVRTSVLWKNEKVHVMLHILKCKFHQCMTFRQELKAFRSWIFVEDTANRFWGRGKNGKGLNTLGALMHRVLLECELGE